MSEHTYVYSTYPYSGNWKEAETHRRAHEFSQHIMTLQRGTLPVDKEKQTFILEPDNLIVFVLKKAF